MPDLPQQNDTLLCAPIGGDLKHPRPIAPNNPVVHLRILADIRVHGSDHSHRRPNLDGLGYPELIEGCKEFMRRKDFVNRSNTEAVQKKKRKLESVYVAVGLQKPRPCPWCFFSCQISIFFPHKDAIHISGELAPLF